MHQIAREYNLKLIDLRLSQCDPTDILGFPNIQGNRAGYLPMDTFPIEGDSLPINPENGQAYNGWLLFLDEFNSASVAVQAASYKVVLDRMVGKYNLHKNVAVVCAGNLETDGAIVEQMSTALQSRIVHMEMVVNPVEWVQWASATGLDHRIISFMEFRPTLLYTFKPDHSDRTYASPRTWEFADSFLKIMDANDADMLPLLAGTLSEGVAREFLSYCKIFDQLPTVAEIMANPESIQVPGEPSILFALSGSIADKINKVNINPLMKYIKRLPLEFQVVCVRMVLGRNKELVNDADMQKWLGMHAEALF